jgi:hypothetical protein
MIEASGEVDARITELLAKVGEGSSEVVVM